MAKGSEVIYTVEEAEFTAGGAKYDVANVSLGIAKKSIPTCHVGIAPASADGSVKVNVLDLVPLKQAFSDLTKKAVELADASLKVKITASEGPRSQSIDLSGWVLISVGLSDITTTNVFSMTCVIAHPAYRLTLMEGFFFDASGTLNFDKTKDGVQNPLQAALVAIETLEAANANKIETLCKVPSVLSTPLKAPPEIDSAVKAGMGKVKGYISQYLEWDPGFTGGKNDIPCDTVLESRHRTGMKYAMAQAWVQNLGPDRTFWSSLIDTVCPWFMVTVIPTYDQPKLKVVPELPWRTPEVEISDDATYSLDMPGFDPNPIYGAIMYEGPGSVPLDPTITYAATAASNSGIQPANLAFIPKDADSSVGSLLHVGDPPFLRIAQSKAGALDPPHVEATGDISYSDEHRVPKPPPTVNNKDLEVWNAVRMMHLNNEFMLAYRQGVSATISCVLSVQAHGSGATVVPGNIMSFMSGGEELFRGEIETITHSIDCSTSRAVTLFQLQYCDVDGGSSSLLGSSPVAPYYNASK